MSVDEIIQNAMARRQQDNVAISQQRRQPSRFVQDSPPTRDVVNSVERHESGQKMMRDYQASPFSYQNSRQNIVQSNHSFHRTPPPMYQSRQDLYNEQSFNQTYDHGKSL